LGVGFSFNPEMLAKGCFKIYPNNTDPVVFVGFIFLIGSLVLSLIIVPICKFRSRKVYGLVLIFYYIIYLVVSILSITIDGFKSFLSKLNFRKF
jgi:Ca2+/Na+ antiporter